LHIPTFETSKRLAGSLLRELLISRVAVSCCWPLLVFRGLWGSWVTVDIHWPQLAVAEHGFVAQI